MPTTLLDLSLSTERLQLRPPVEADIDAIVAGIGDFVVSKWLTKVRFPYGREDAEAWLGLCAAGMAEGTDLPLLLLEAGIVIGCVGLHRLETPLLGYWLAKSAWGKGFATEACEAALGFGFDKLGKTVIHSSVFEENRASLRVQLKLGFEITGHGRAHCLARGCEVPDIKTSLTAERFRAHKR